MDVTLEMHEEIALLRFDDGKKNAITLDAIADLNQAIDKAEADAKALVLVGRPGSFCAGFDLSVMMGSDAEAIKALGTGGGRIAHRLYGFPKPVVGACTGHAFTIGALWLLASDVRVGEAGAHKLAMIETQVDYVLGPWSMELLRDRIARTYFVPTVLHSKVYDPESAIEAGFLDEVVGEGESEERALALAAELVKLPPRAYAGNKMASRSATLEVMAQDLSG